MPSPLPLAIFESTPPTKRLKKSTKRSTKPRRPRRKPTSGRSAAVPNASVASSPRAAIRAASCAPVASGSRILNVPSLPLTLDAPVLKDIDQQEIYKVFPKFAGADLTLLRKVLAKPSFAQAMIDGAVGCEIEEPPYECNDMFPTHVQITIFVTTAPTRICPSHVLASTRFYRGHAHGFYLYAIHSLPFALNCTKLVEFPASDTTTTGSIHTAYVPVIFVDLPSAETFECLRTYLYNKDLEELEGTLLPPRSRWAARMETVERRVAFITGLWKNACFLGVVDEAMYAVIARTWDVVYKDRFRLINGGHKISC